MENSWAGKSLKDYDIIDQIGQGGMAVVYRAHQRTMNRDVAIKILAPNVSQTEDFIQRFEREVRTIAQLEHARILPVHDYGDADGVPYLVMRYLRGGTLRERITEQGAMPPAEAGRILRQVAEGLSYAHSKSVIHRDVTSNNIMFDDNGDILLTDFGLARISQGNTAVSVSSSMLGTPRYVSPEQVMGEKVDHRADLYSLGIVLYEMLVGEAPFDGDNPMSVAVKHVNTPLPDPQEANPDLSPAVASVLIKACAKEPGDRFQDAMEMVEAYTRAVQHGVAADVKAPAPAAPGEQPGFPMWLLGVLVAVVIVVGGLIAVQAVRSNRTADVVPTATEAVVFPGSQATETEQPPVSDSAVEETQADAPGPTQLPPATPVESGSVSGGIDICGPGTELAYRFNTETGFDGLSGELAFTVDEGGILIQPGQGMDKLLINGSAQLSRPHIHLRGVTWPDGPGQLAVLLFATETNEAMYLEITANGVLRLVSGTDVIEEYTDFVGENITIATTRTGVDVLREQLLIRVSSLPLTTPQPMGFIVRDNPVHIDEINVCSQVDP